MNYIPNIIKIKLFETLIEIRLDDEGSNEETDINNISKYDFDEINPILSENLIIIQKN